MGVFDLVGRMIGMSPDVDDPEVTETSRSLVEAARSDRLTPEQLALPGDRTSAPLIEYLEDDERPQYVMIGTRVLISDVDGTLLRKHPTRKVVVLVSDRRILIVVGGRSSDDLLEVPLADVSGIHLDHDPPRHFIVVDANKDGDPMTFFVEITIDPDPETVEDGVEYVRSHSP